MAKAQKQGGKKNRKYGRNEAKCKQYKAQSTREANKVARIAKREAKLTRLRAKKGQ